MSEKLKTNIQVVILPIIGGALLGISKNNGAPQVAEIKPPKDLCWLNTRKMKRMPKSGKK